jgi:hypothetical protein
MFQPANAIKVLVKKAVLLSLMFHVAVVADVTKKNLRENGEILQFGLKEELNANHGSQVVWMRV